MRTAMKMQWKATEGDVSPGSDVLRRLQMQKSANALYPQRSAAATRSEDYSFHKAGLLDIPFIFYLIEEGSLTGAFPATYLTPKGWTSLFSLLTLDILRPRRFCDDGICDIKTLIFTRGDEDIGFMQIGCMNGGHVHVIKYCAIAQRHRDQGHGSQMIRMYTEKLSAPAEVVAYCTKFNKAMPRVLKKLGFRRENADSGYDCYHLKDR